MLGASGTGTKSHQQTEPVVRVKSNSLQRERCRVTNHHTTSTRTHRGKTCLLCTLQRPPRKHRGKERSTSRVVTGRVLGSRGRLTKEREPPLSPQTLHTLCAAHSTKGEPSSDLSVEEKAEWCMSKPKPAMRAQPEEESGVYIIICPVMWLVRHAMEAHDPPPHRETGCGVVLECLKRIEGSASATQRRRV